MVLQDKGEVAHLLPLFQGCMVEECSLSAVAVHTVVGGSTGSLVGGMVEPVPGGVGCSVLHLWWREWLLLSSVLLSFCRNDAFSDDGKRGK